MNPTVAGEEGPDMPSAFFPRNVVFPSRTQDLSLIHIYVIPDTQKRTTMLHWRPGSRVNMETDLIGKYVRRIMQCQADGPAAPQKSSGINKEFLLQNGFL